MNHANLAEHLRAIGAQLDRYFQLLAGRNCRRNFMLPYIIANSNPAGHGLLPGLRSGGLGCVGEHVQIGGGPEHVLHLKSPVSTIAHNRINLALTLNQSISRPTNPEHNRVLKDGEPNG